MANLGQTFDPAQVPVDENRPDFELIPSSWQEAQVIESEVVDTKAGNGKMLNLTLEIIAGQYEKRKLWDRINIQNASAKAQEIGQRTLADLCEAAGVGAINDSEVLHYKPMLVRVGTEKQEGFEAKNVIKRYKARGNVTTAPASRPSAAQPASQAPAAAQQQRPAAVGSRPWGQKKTG